jgi:2-polyprenyl-3-methyl-5-hydroxy-6-metoxy-1,4-benzoquinol methylase
LDDKTIERLSKCPLCKSGLFLNAIEVKDHAVSKELFIVCKCTNCKVQFTNPRPTSDHIGRYYDFPEYYSHDDSAKNLTQLIYQNIRKITITRKVALINSLVKEKGKLLDYGCGTGEFLNQAKIEGWNVSGCEPNKKASNLASQKISEKIFSELDDLDSNQSFDVITLFHVLEHVHKLRKTVKSLLKLLKPDGYLVIAIPNPESYDAKKYGDTWAGWDVPRHLYHFNSDAMKSFQEVFNLELVDLKKMPFDSYYVSLLSESYKNPTASKLLNYWNATWSGLKSNKSANGKAGNYSSNIYLFKKK